MAKEHNPHYHDLKLLLDDLDGEWNTIISMHAREQYLIGLDNSQHTEYRILYSSVLEVSELVIGTLLSLCTM